jgi:hypothetical protein
MIPDPKLEMKGLRNAAERAREQHFFWFNEACVAVSDMAAIGFDTTTQGTEKFAQAKARFDHACRQCKVEYDMLCFNAGLANAIIETTRREAEKNA